MSDEDRRRDREREPAAVENFSSVRAEEREVEREEQRGSPPACHGRPAPAVAGDHVEEHDVIAIVPVTAMPYAAASALDELEAEHERAGRRP